VAGKPFSGAGAAEISLPERFAERLGLKIGDELLFDVQGIEVAAKAVNLRKVRWTSFQPNFFVLFPDGVLNGAPKIFLGSVAELTDEKKDEVISAVASRFPNVSLVDVKATVRRALEVVDRMRWSLNLMSVISLFAGFVVLYSIADRQAELRRWDINLCRVLGASARDLRIQQAWEFGLLSAAAGSFGAFLSVAFTWVASYYLFEGVFHVDPLPLLAAVLGTTALGLAVAAGGARAVDKHSAAELLQEQAL